ncbi:MAG TPA: hypothetical protein VGC91_12245 [Pyrinomonadaceae bacterium]|jgi:tetratricopeptide (TPR) repeat protein
MRNRSFASIMLNAIFFFSFGLLCFGVIQAQPGDLRTPKQIAKELKEKLARANEYIRENPDDANYYDDRGEVYMEFFRQAEKLSETQDERAAYAERAFADFDKAIELAPNSSIAFFKRAEYRQWTDWLLNSDAVISDYLEAIRLSKANFHLQHPNLAEDNDDDSAYAETFLKISYVYSNRAKTLSMKPVMLGSYGLKPEQLAEFRLLHPQYSVLDDLDAAVECSKKVMANAELAAIYEPWLVTGNLMLKGNAAFQLKQYQVALDAYDSAEAYWNKKIDIACQRTPNPCAYNTNYDKKIFRYSLSLSLAKVYLKLKESKKALAELNYYLSDEKNNQCSEPFGLRAIAYRWLGQDELAEADEKRAGELPRCGNE